MCVCLSALEAKQLNHAPIGWKVLGSHRDTDSNPEGARCGSVVRAFAHGAMGRRIDPSWWTHWAFLVPASAPRLV